MHDKQINHLIITSYLSFSNIQYIFRKYTVLLLHEFSHHYSLLLKISFNLSVKKFDVTKLTKCDVITIMLWIKVSNKCLKSGHAK